MRHQYKAERRPMKTNAHANDKQGRGGGLMGPFQPEEPRKHESEPMSWAWSKDPEMRRRWASSSFFLAGLTHTSWLQTCIIVTS